jgi:peptidyl-prolyl cis-trans isomerase A (cyclophilin A)
MAQTPASAPASSRLMTPAALNEKAPDKFKVKFTTTRGEFVVEVNRVWAPLGADRFYNLVKNGFFTDASFFRVVPDFIVQFGIPADPAVARVWQRASFKDDPVRQGNRRGTLVFATAGANTRTTQFFVNLKDNSSALDDKGFAPFGSVVSGMKVVDSLYSGYGEGSDMGGKGPVQGLVQSQGKPYLDKNFPKLDSIKSATIEAAGADAKK